MSAAVHERGLAVVDMGWGQDGVLCVHVCADVRGLGAHCGGLWGRMGLAGHASSRCTSVVLPWSTWAEG